MAADRLIVVRKTSVSAASTLRNFLRETMPDRSGAVEKREYVFHLREEVLVTGDSFGDGTDHSPHEVLARKAGYDVNSIKIVGGLMWMDGGGIIHTNEGSGHFASGKYNGGFQNWNEHLFSDDLPPREKILAFFKSVGFMRTIHETWDGFRLG